MEMVWISTVIGALTGGLAASTCVVLLSAPLWSLLFVYPGVGLVTAAGIYAFWRMANLQHQPTTGSTLD